MHRYLIRVNTKYRFVSRLKTLVRSQVVLTLLIGVFTGYYCSNILFPLPKLVASRDPPNYDAGHPVILAIKEHDIDEPAHRDDNRSIADELAKKVRVLCWVMTLPKDHTNKAQQVKATWGKRCNKLLFMSSKEDADLPAIKLPFETERRSKLWAKTKEAFRYVYEHHREDGDWFLKTDDDTYVILENLRYLLSEHNTSEPMYFGCRLNSKTNQSFMSGGAGYVLSREALHRLVITGLPSPHLCVLNETGAEDAMMGICLEKLGVRAMDTRDKLGRGRFFPNLPRHHLFLAKEDSWFERLAFYPSDEGLQCCSDYAISFHYVSPLQMYIFEYLIYHLGAYRNTTKVLKQADINLTTELS